MYIEEKKIYVTYKNGLDQVVQVPSRSITLAKQKADNLYKQGYLNVKVIKVKEELIYSPYGV